MTTDLTQPTPTPLVVADRYEILADIGRGGQAYTFAARDRQSGERVVLKELDLRRAGDWKAVELFEREGDVLRSLDHPGIPRYLDAFSLDDDAATRFFLVQEFVPGESLRQKIEAGELLDEEQARALLAELFDILDYLHSQSPPVVHRDIKPANIMVRPAGAGPGGRFALIDFGAVQEVVQGAVGGETVVGTTGFLPPEQLMGRAKPASDLYALGATVVYAMCGVHPSDLPTDGMRLDYHGLVDCSPRFEAFLDRMLEPVVEDRLSDVAEARVQLADLPVRLSDDVATGKQVATRKQIGAVEYARQGDKLLIEIAPRTPRSLPIAITFAIAILMSPVLFLPGPFIPLPLLAPLPVIAALWFGDFGSLHYTIELDSKTFRYTKRLGPLRRTRSGPLGVLREAVNTAADPRHSARLTLLVGMQRHALADQLEARDGQEVIGVINDFLNDFHR